MNTQALTREQLTDELEKLRRQVAELQKENSEIRQTEERLEEIQRQWQTIYKNLPISILIWRRTGEKQFILQDYNRRSDEATGGQYRAMIGHDAKEVHRTRPDVIKAMEKCFIENRNIVREGSYVYEGRGVERVLSTIYSPISDEIVLVISQDITEARQAAEALRESEEKYRTILENIEDAYYEVDLQGNLTFFNDAMCRILGYAQDDLMGMNNREYMSVENAKKVFQIFNEVFRSDRSDRGIDWRFIKKDGTEIDVEASVSLIKDKQGRAAGFRGLLRDVTERKGAEEALRQSEERYRLVLQSEGVSYYQVDLGGNITYLSQWALNSIGGSTDQETSRQTRDYMTPDSAEKLAEAFSRVYQTGEPLQDIEYEATMPDGIPRIIQLSASLMKDRDGQPIGFHGLTRDITERKRAEEARRQSDERYRTIIESIEEGYFESDLEGKFTFVNDWLAASLGRSSEEVIGMSNRDYMPEDSAKKVYRAFVQLYETGEPLKKLDYEVILGDGSHRFHELSASLRRDQDGQPIGFRGLARDVTNWKLAEEELKKAKVGAEAANQAKSEFLANMSHEIRTPMNAVIGFADMLFDTDLNDEQRNYAATIKKGGESLLSLISDILDFSKIEAGDLELEEIDFDPELVAYDICELVQPRAKAKPIEILCHIGENLPSSLKGDPTRFRQILTNLMGNAVKFTDSGEIDLSLDLLEEKDSRVKIHASVRDTGIGLPEEKREIIFQPFHQADGSTTRRYGGTGLGLSISKKIVNLMDGEIWVESEVGQGSTFHFTSWFGKGEEKEPKRFAFVSTRGKKILVIDDNQTNLELLASVLKSVRLRVVALEGGDDVMTVLEKAKAEGDPFDLCISDIQMPGFSGYDVARRMRDPKSGFSDLPLIALSSLLERDARKCEEAGFDGFLPKPIHRDKLFQLIERILVGREGRIDQDEAARERIITQHVIREEQKHSVSILLAEDNPDNQALAKLILTKAGYQVDVADNGREAVEKFTAAPDNYDLILMDIQMPEMDGLEATWAIRELGFKIPIVAMTAHAMKGDREKYIEWGMDDYITKPIKREIVYSILEKWIFQKGLTSIRILLADDSADSRLLIQSYLKEPPFELQVVDNAEEAIQDSISGNFDIVLMNMQLPGADGYTAIKKIREREAEKNSEPIPIIALTNREYEEEIKKGMEAGSTSHLIKPIRKAKLLETIQKYAYIEEDETKDKREDSRKGERIIISVDRDLEDLIPGFLRNRIKDIESIKNALEKRDYESIRILGHSMKGAGGGYGFDAITDIGRSIEEAAKANDSKAVITGAEALSAYLDKVEVVFEG